MDQCKIHELFQCAISDMQARSVCPSKQFIESKLADFAWEILMLLYITFYKCNQALLQHNLDDSIL